MARNAEKARTLFNRFTTLKEEYGKSTGKEGHKLGGDAMSLGEAVEWRNHAISKIVRNIKAIQNGLCALFSPLFHFHVFAASLGEFKVREMNDLINKALKERTYWDHRVRDLGGTPSVSSKLQMLEAEGVSLPGARGYKYFGAAKDLPGVRELFEQYEEERKEREKPKRTTESLAKLVNPLYFASSRTQVPTGLVSEGQAEGGQEESGKGAMKRRERVLMEQKEGEFRQRKRQRVEEEEKARREGLQIVRAGEGDGGRSEARGKRESPTSSSFCPPLPQSSAGGTFRCLPKPR